MINKFRNKHIIFYDQALKEIKSGRKTSHWMWYIFPQVRGLGMSPISYEYGIPSLEVAKEYLKDEYLYSHLIEISGELLKHNDLTAVDIFGEVDAKKLRSSMTLFLEASGDTIFREVLIKYFDNIEDDKTLELLKKEDK